MRLGGAGHDGGRTLKTRVKTARKRSLSSTLWLERQLNDPFVAQARSEGYRSRAAFKLIEIAEKHRLFRPGQRIVDLGAAPGGFSQVAADKTQAREGMGRVVAIDLLDMAPIEGVEFLKLDFHDADAPERLKQRLGGAMRQAGIIAAACIYALENNVERLADDHRNAKRLAARLSELPGLRIDPDEVETNILMIDCAETGTPAAEIARALDERFAVRVSTFGPRKIRAVTHLDVSAQDVERAADAFEEVLRSL